MDVTIGTSSFLLVKKKATLGLYGNIVKGASDSAGVISDLQTKVRSPPLYSDTCQG